MAELPRRIPIFPLPNVVLFPQMPLPLRVFEPRYIKLVTDVLAKHKTIGMMLLEPGWESDYQGRPPVYPVGCAGVVHQCERLEYGRFDILLRGACRFRIVEEHAGEPYRVATVESLPETPGDTEALGMMRRKVMAAIGRAADGPAVLVLQTELPHDVFVNALCQSLSLTPVERQSLLSCDTTLARGARLLEVLEFKLLEETYGATVGHNVH